MRHLNLDKEKSLQEAIGFTVNGKTFECVDFTDEVMAEIEALSEREDLAPNASLAEQLAVFTGEDPSAFDDLSFVQKSGAISHITAAISDPLGKSQRRNGRR